jgi:hypothetical protein
VVKCPRCGAEGRLEEYEVNGRVYLRVVYGSGKNRVRCYLGPAESYAVAGPLLGLFLRNLHDNDYAHVVEDSISILEEKVKLHGLSEAREWLPRVTRMIYVLEEALPRLRKLQKELERLEAMLREQEVSSEWST